MQEYWRCNLADNHPVITAATSLARLSPMIWSSFAAPCQLPANTVLGLTIQRMPSAKDRLVNAYDQMQKAWLNNRA